jgi:hypothetical protein
MVKDLFDTLQAVVKGVGVRVINLNNVSSLGSAKLATRFSVKLLAIPTLLYGNSLA